MLSKARCCAAAAAVSGAHSNPQRLMQGDSPLLSSDRDISGLPEASASTMTVAIDDMLSPPAGSGASEPVSENSIHKVDFAMHRENRVKLAARMRDAGAPDHSLLVCGACLFYSCTILSCFENFKNYEN
jgi:hypothetical protein